MKVSLRELADIAADKAAHEKTDAALQARRTDAVLPALLENHREEVQADSGHLHPALLEVCGGHTRRDLFIGLRREPGTQDVGVSKLSK